MKSKFLLVLAIIAIYVSPLAAQAPAWLLDEVRNHPILASVGGADVFQKDNALFIVGVGKAVVNNQPEKALKRVTFVKAQKEVYNFLNGENITSERELKTSQETIDGKLVVTEEFYERIRSNIQDVVRFIPTLTTWYDEDQSNYFQAVYIQVN